MVWPRRQVPGPKGLRATPEASRIRGSRIKYVSLALVVALAIAAALVGDVSAQSSEPPTNVLVNPEEEPAAFEYPWIARDPARSGRLAIAHHKNNTTCYLARSANDGASWENTVVVGPGAQFPLPVGNQCSRPSIAYGPDGTLYYAFSTITGGQGFPPPAVVFVMASRDGGATFTAPVRASRPGDVSDINPQVAVDQDSGRLHVVWQENRPSLNVVVASSGDGGQSFSPGIRPFPEGGGGPGAVAVGSDGRVYVVRRGTTNYAQSKGALPIEAQVASSTDGGRTFGEPVTALRLRSCFSPDNSCQRNAQGAFTFNPSVSVAAGDSPGEVFLAGSYLGDDNIFRFRLGASNDGGHTWTETNALGIPAAVQEGEHHQLVPTVAVAPNGRIDIVYYDLAQPSGLQDTYLISSSDGGSTFSAPEKISSAPSPTTGRTGNDPYSVGHPLTSTNDAASVAWTDARRGKLDIFFARALAPLAPVGEPIPVAPPVPPAPPVGPRPCGVPGAAGYLQPAKLRVSRAQVLREDRRLDVLAPITSLADGDVAVTFHADDRKDTFDEDVSEANSALDVIRVSKPITRGQARLGTGIVNITYLGDEDTRPQFVRLRAASQRAELDVAEISLIDDRLSAEGSVTSRAQGIVRFRYSYVDFDGSPNVHEARTKIQDDGDFELEGDQVPAQLARCGGYLSIQFTGYFSRRIRGEQLAYQLGPGQPRRP